MYSLQDQQRALEAWFKDMESGLPPSKLQAALIKKQAENLTKTEQLAKRLVDQAQGKLVHGLQDWTKAMYEGQQGMEALTGQIEAVAALATILTSVLFPGLSLLTIAVAGLGSAVAAYAKKASQQADGLFKTYQDLSKTGMATGGGMTDVYNNMQRLNYGIKELAQMTELLKQNSQVLANFGGTASAGARAFAGAADQIQHSDVGRTFQMMGKTPDDINRGIAGFIKNQQDLGVNKSRIFSNLAEHSAEYIKEIDVLNRMTGQSEEQVQEKIAQAMSENAFNQIQYELQRRADAGDLVAKAQLKRNRDLAAILPGKIREEFIRGIAGDYASMDLTIKTAPLAAQLMQTQNFTTAQYIDAVTKGIQESRERYGPQIKLNLTKDFIFSTKDMSEMARYNSESAQSQLDRAKDEQELQKKNLDPTTKKMVELRIDQQKTRDALQNFVNKGIKPTVTVMEALEGGLNTVLGIVPGTKSEVRGGEQPTGNEKPKNTQSESGYPAGVQLVKIKTKSGLTASVNAKLQGKFQNLVDWLESKGYNITSIGGYNPRKIAGTNIWSAHSYGAAIDINPAQNPMGSKLITDMPAGVSAYAKSLGLGWGGDWSNKKDAMHFSAQPHEGGAGGYDVSGDQGWKGTISGPTSGYRPDIVMHGEEQLTITPKNKTITTAKSPFNADTAMLMKTRLEKINRVVELFQEKQRHKQTVPLQNLEQFNSMVKNMQNQVDVSTKILQAVR